MALQGHLETIQEDGLIGGWCWDSDDPALQLRLDVLVDNEPVGHTLANVFRADLETAGIGDGAHAFAFLLPWSAIASKSVSTIRICDSRTGHTIGGSVTFRRGALLPLEQRMIELEHSMRMLQARLAETNERAARDANLLRSMLGTIGSFFTQLSDMPPEAVSIEGAFGIAALVAHARTQYEPFALAQPETPALTVCVSGDGSLAETYGCLLALRQSGIDAEAEIVLLDTGLSAELALLPSLVQNLRYWRAAPGESPITARNRIAGLSDRELVLFLSAAIRMTPDWLAGARASFAAQPYCAVLASRVLRADGTVQSSALLPDRTGRLADFAYAEQASFPWFDRLMPAAAAPEAAVAIRGSVFQALEGFDPGFPEFAASITDFCLRCWEAGHSVLYQPRCSLGWSATGGLGGFGAAARDPALASRLAERWEQAARPAWPRASGRALLLDDAAAAAPATILDRAETLQRLGYDVVFGDTGGLDHEPVCAEALRATGVAVLRAPFTPTLAGVIETARPAFALAELSGRAAATMAPETIRSLSPVTRIVLRLEPAAEEQLLAEPGKAASPLHAAVETSDAIVTGNSDLAAQFGKGKARGPAVLSLAPKGAEDRRGLWLLLEGEAAGADSAEQWLATLLPAIIKALPKVQIHAVKNSAAKFPKSVNQHAAAAADAALLANLRIALAPFKKPAADAGAIGACLAAGLPVVATPPALGDEAAAPGVLTVSATAQSVTRVLRQLETDD
ncbi:MAG TPA: hypothetical protein VL752_00005, partial [Acidisoma sp.]|uniref:glycosyltransferase family 2 protein n=1 Tax=Acidisoma sp. TaxID=1872115 RepID=UPI002BF75232